MSFLRTIIEEGEKKKGKKRKVPYRFGVPAKYLAGLSDEEAKKRAAAIKKRGDKYEKGKKKIKDDDLPGDQPDTKDSPSTKRYHEKYGKPESKKKKSKKENHEMTGSILNEVVQELLLEEDKKKFIAKVAKDTGISSSILSQVYSRGMAAARSSGNRPGANPVSWAKARVYSFVENDKKHDKDLHRKRSDSKKPKWAGDGEKKKEESKSKKKKTNESYMFKDRAYAKASRSLGDIQDSVDTKIDSDEMQEIARRIAPIYANSMGNKRLVMNAMSQYDVPENMQYQLFVFIKRNLDELLGD
jgi:hypothetical protein